MDRSARRFARRILLVHVLLLVGVLLIVAVAAREIYIDTRDEVLDQAEARQRMLANETARGIENYYRSILNDVDLMHQAEETPTTATTESAADKAADRAVAAARGPLIGQVMWRQLEGRVTALFAVDRTGQTTGEPPPDERGGPPGDRGGPPGDERRRPFGTRQSERTTITTPNGVMTVDRPAVPVTRTIGTCNPAVTIDGVMTRSRSWMAALKSPGVGPVQTFGEVRANVICVPLPRGRGIAAVVPTSEIERRFIEPFRESTGPIPARSNRSDTDDVGRTAVWLTDEAGTVMAASRPELIGLNVNQSADPEFVGLAKAATAGAQTRVIDRAFQVGASGFGPDFVSARAVSVADKKWTLFVATDVKEVDGVVGGLFHRALWWCVFVVVSISAILTSTAAQMIRGRIKAERARHEILNKELAQAREIQLAWLPDQRPAGSAVDVAAVNSPASHISGDFYDWFDLPDGRLVVTIGDVTGHGMAAAFLMATTQLLVRNTMANLGDPGRCLAEVNRQLCVQVFNGQFVTMLVVVVDTEGGQVQVATAGHPSPLMSDGDGPFEPLAVEPQLVLGVDRETVYTTERFDLPGEAMLLLYTDGVVECPDGRDCRFGTENLRRTLHGRIESARDMLDKVVAAVDLFRGKRELDDDLTLVSVRIQPSRVEAVAAGI